MDRSLNPGLGRLDVLVGAWEITASTDGRVLSTARATFAWLGDSGFLGQRVDAPSFLVPEWVGAAPLGSHAMIGLDDHTDTFVMLYSDARGVCRTYAMTFGAGRWTLAGRPGDDFHQRFAGQVSDDGSTIDARWEASPDGETWDTDFDVTYRRLVG
ncbi:hypothetical protein ICW40_06270 [Actinotalea ferrariae]|uniref:hypothetical protein n=1 Tax=Actinotalea ferrariae TaxID=1386098 RepID=UPI001C8C7A56|nr:hypothetical protein [Actinotalea ferrariae]MBX9244411.1 hypothetical protein [Actinotalea ferrariae]